MADWLEDQIRLAVERLQIKHIACRGPYPLTDEKLAAIAERLPQKQLGPAPL